MEVSEDAKKLLESRVSKILIDIDIPENNKSDIRKELISNYTDASAMKAQARGVLKIERSDVELAFGSSESPQEIAAMYMASYVSTLKRAGIISRSIAYIIDNIIVSLITFIASLPFIIFGALLLQETNLDFLPLILRFYYAIIIVQLSIVFIYFSISEGFYGFTPGKWLLGLKVLRTDGKRISYRESMLRTIPKLFIVAIVADALFMVLVYRKEKQRLFDNIASTIVIHRNK
jgi:uncharacterized RDD family membrane protein YckC